MENNELTTAVTEDVHPSQLRYEFSELAKLQREFSSTAQLAFVRNTVAKGMTDEEIFMFLYKSQKMGFNPLTGEVIGYMANDRENNTRSLVLIPTRDGKRRQAYRRADIEYIDTKAIYVRESEGKNVRCEPWEGGILWGAESIIKRVGISEPFKVVVPLSEYDTGKKAWINKKDTMIKKVAESQCLSSAVPELGGLYEMEEVSDIVDTKNAPSSSIEAPKDLPDNEESISPALNNTIQAMAESQGVNIDTTDMTMQEGRKILENLMQRGKE